MKSIKCSVIILIIFIGVCFITKGSTQLKYKNVSELPVYENASKVELKLSPEFIKAAKRETGLNEKDILAVINRWHGELYSDTEESNKTTLAYMLAVLIDPVTSEMSNELKEKIAKATTDKEKMMNIYNWGKNRLRHTQFEKVFQGFPGRDPWGLKDNDRRPTFKKLLPSEMKAMTMHIGYASAKCITLANFMASLYIHLGINPDDIIILLIRQKNYRHAFALMKYENQLYHLENVLMGPHSFFKMSEIHVLGVINHNGIIYKSFTIQNSELKTADLITDKPFITEFLEHYNIFGEFKNYHLDEHFDLSDTGNLKSSVFLNKEQSDIAYLAKYAYQSLYVKYPEYYLSASVRSSVPKELAGTLATPGKIFEWMRTHIAFGSIFEDSRERLMTADQVLVFQRGSLKDQAVLAYTLLKHKGFEPEILLTEDNAYVKPDKKYISVKDWKKVKKYRGKLSLN